MQRGVALSVLLHATVFAVAYVGVPHLRREPPILETPIMVEIATVSELSNPPPPAPEPAKEAKAKPEAPKPPPEPPKARPAPPPPAPPPEPEPAPKVAALPPPPEAKPKAEKKPEPKPEPEAKPKPRSSPVLANAKPLKKPPPPDAFASVLRTLEELKQRPPKPKDKPPEEKGKPKDEKTETFEQQIAKALTAPSRPHDPSRPLAISEIDLVRQQIIKCWNVPAGAKEAWNLVVEVSVVMNPDGTVRDARVQDAGRMARDPFYRAAAESALRAVKNPRCQPFKLPPEKYDQWRDMVLNFDPREML